MEQMPTLRQNKSAQAPSLRQYLTFVLSGEDFAIPIEHIREIIEFKSITTIPLMPAFLRGVINLRGAVVPVVDMAARFARGATTVGQRTCVVIVEISDGDETQVLGIMVDAVNEVIDVDAAQIEPRPAFGAKIRSDFIENILNIDQEFVVVLDVCKVLSVDEIADLIGAMSEPEAAAAG